MTDAEAARPPRGDLELVDALRAGDESAFMRLVERLQPQMLRIARMYVSTTAVAEEVVQEAWVGVLKGLDGFEGRSSLRTWILRILVNTAKTRGQREARSVPFSSLWSPDAHTEPAVDPGRFLPEGQESGRSLDGHAGGLGVGPGGPPAVAGDPGPGRRGYRYPAAQPA